MPARVLLNLETLAWTFFLFPGMPWITVATFVCSTLCVTACSLGPSAEMQSLHHYYGR